MIRTVFIDAVFLVSLINPRDQNHQKAKEALKSVQGTQLVTTDAVLTEVLNYYSERVIIYDKKPSFWLKLS